MPLHNDDLFVFAHRLGDLVGHDQWPSLKIDALRAHFRAQIGELVQLVRGVH